MAGLRMSNHTTGKNKTCQTPTVEGWRRNANKSTKKYHPGFLHVFNKTKKLKTHFTARKKLLNFFLFAVGKRVIKQVQLLQLL